MLVTPPWVHEEKVAESLRHFPKGTHGRYNVLTERYADALVELGAHTLHVPVLDIFRAMDALPLKTRMSLLSDGLHFS